MRTVPISSRILQRILGEDRSVQRLMSMPGCRTICVDSDRRQQCWCHADRWVNTAFWSAMSVS